MPIYENKIGKFKLGQLMNDILTSIQTHIEFLFFVTYNLILRGKGINFFQINIYLFNKK
jgi:hypothetical protein